MKEFNFEKNLSYHENAIESNLVVFENQQLYTVAGVDKRIVQN